MMRFRTFAAGLGLALLAALPARAAIEIVETVTPGGVEVWLVPEPSIPMLALELRFLGGAALDPEGRAGATALMTYLLEEGAGARDAAGFAEAAEALAARFSFRVDSDAVSVSARMLTETRDEAVSLLSEALGVPRFDPDAVERVRGQLLANLRAAALDQGDIAGDTFAAIAYAGHPYAIPSDGLIDDVAALTVDDLRRAHRAALARDRVIVSAVGDITPEALAELVDRLLADLPAAGAPLPAPAEVTLEPGMTIVPYDAPQTVVAFGHAGIPRDDPDFLAAFVVNEVMGGGRFSSRLMQSLREERGLTYGVYSYLFPRQWGATYQGGFSAANGAVAEAIALVRAEWARMAESGLSAAELDAVITFLTGEYPLRFDSNAAIARILSGMQMQGLPADYVDIRNDLLRALTPDEVARVAARIMDPEALHFVVVGQPEGLGQDH